MNDVAHAEGFTHIDPSTGEYVKSTPVADTPAAHPLVGKYPLPAFYASLHNAAGKFRNRQRRKLSWKKGIVHRYARRMDVSSHLRKRAAIDALRLNGMVVPEVYFVPATSKLSATRGQR